MSALTDLENIASIIAGIGDDASKLPVPEIALVGGLLRDAADVVKSILVAIDSGVARDALVSAVKAEIKAAADAKLAQTLP